MDVDRCRACEIITNILSAYAMVLIVFGTVGNLWASFICFRPPLQKVSSFRILSILFIFEIFSLYTWNLDIFLKFFVENKGVETTIESINIIESLNLVTCKIFAFLQFYSLQCISWFLMYISVDQFVKLYWPNTKYSMKPKFVYPICFVNIRIIF